MKRLIFIFFTGTLLLFYSSSLAQNPPHPNGGGAPGSGNNPVGGGAPVGGGLIVLSVLGVLYASKKTLRLKS